MRRFWLIVMGVLFVDLGSKVAIVHLLAYHESVRVVGDLVRFSLVYNPGGTMGVSFGILASKIVFSVLGVGVVGVLVRLAVGMVKKEGSDQGRAEKILGMALMAGGAMGNLVDRLVGSRGVVDFLDVGVGLHRFWIFNVADVAVTLGGVILALVVTRYEMQAARALKREREYQGYVD